MGFANVAGFVSAFVAHGAISIFGLSVILMQSAMAFTVIKYLGAAYLCWIGIKALIAALGDQTPPTHSDKPLTRTSLRGAYIEGLLTNVLNPKVSMFYVAAFPQFITATDNPAAWSVLLVSLHAFINAVWFSAMILLFHRLTGAARHHRVQRGVKLVTGGVFIGFGAKLALLRSPT
jgi:threonine/homoserine/homoserine lactone efflux protein